MGYLVLLEQIGEAVRRRRGRTAQNGIPRALAHFGDGRLDDPSVGTLVALRNAFAHNYSLVALGGPHTPSRLFRLSDAGLVVKPPDSPWNRDWHAHPERDATHVNVVALADVVEGVVACVGEAWWAGDLDTDLPGGRDELRARFLFGYSGD